MRNSTQIEIEKAGERVVASLYNGKPDEDLNTLRYRRFVQKVNTATTVIQVQTLPPTQASSKFHSYRAYLQVQVSVFYRTGQQTPCILLDRTKLETYNCSTNN